MEVGVEVEKLIEIGFTTEEFKAGGCSAVVETSSARSALAARVAWFMVTMGVRCP